MSMIAPTTGGNEVTGQGLLPTLWRRSCARHGAQAWLTPELAMSCLEQAIRIVCEPGITGSGEEADAVGVAALEEGHAVGGPSGATRIKRDRHANERDDAG
jgi:hypothetical protein